MINEFSIFQESVPAQYQDLFDRAQQYEATSCVLNKLIKVVDERNMKEVDTVNTRVD